MSDGAWYMVRQDDGFVIMHAKVVAHCLREDDAKAIVALQGKCAAMEEVMGWASGVLTALNVGNVQSNSPLHLKLREVMIAYRAKLASLESKHEQV